MTSNFAIEGGGIWNAAPLKVDEDSRVTGNTATKGGGIFNASSSSAVTLASAGIVTNNTATGTEPNGDNCLPEGTITNCLG